MRALLDTNVIIHRENTKATSFTIGKLFYWLDKLHYEKLIHPCSIDELRKYRNPQMQSLYDAKIEAEGADRGDEGRNCGGKAADGFGRR